MTTPNSNTVNGLQAIRRVDSAKFGDSLTVYYVPAANQSALFVGDPVSKVAGSANDNGINGINLATAGSNAVVTGVVAGFVGVQTAGSTQPPSMFGLSGMPGNVYRPASTSYDYYALVCDDPEAMFTVQVTSTDTIDVADVGKNFQLVSGTGNTYTGWSGWTIASSPVAGASDLGQVNVLGFLQAPNNDPTQPYAKVTVRLNTSTETNRSAGI